MSGTTFAEVQSRIIERRQARTAQSFSSSRSESHPLQKGILSNGLHSARTIANWITVSRPPLRVGQLDADALDQEIIELLRNQVGDALKYVSGLGSTLKDDWADEIGVLLKALLFKLSVWDHDATYGAAIQNLRFVDGRYNGTVAIPPSKWQKCAYGVFTVGSAYAWTKWEAWLVRYGDTFGAPSARVQTLRRLTSAASTMHATAAFTSFLMFLIRGQYRTLLDRMLRLRLGPITNQTGQAVSLEYLNRQLVWHAFTEFLLFLLPLLGVNRWRRWVARAWRRATQVTAFGSGNDKSAAARSGFGVLAFLPGRTCAICFQEQNTATTEEGMISAAAARSGGIVGSASTDITNPYETIPCGCVYCFACIAARIEGEDGDGWSCLRCNQRVTQCRPWDGDVLSPRTELSPAVDAFA